MKQIIVTPKDCLSKADVSKLAKEGVIVLQVEDPSKVVMLMPSGNVECNDMIMAGMKGSADSFGSKTSFFDELYRRMKTNEVDGQNIQQ